ncbi:hypothetical protein FHS43_000006 [Streptosporangium becharense]|uniref:Uncharacterized protein n=1 Tax=Streptosporangium becharense TaxID=1816182 RepID=A0A7W9IGE9_9ACTN|nr:hypothetical protein [Streptosporangium becharense]MBB5820222.1 hypothetical protein [Streptosporangium becharense]
MTNQCVSCEGRGWKYVSPRGGLLAGTREAVPFFRVRDDCSACWGTHPAEAVEPARPDVASGRAS